MPKIKFSSELHQNMLYQRSKLDLHDKLVVKFLMGESEVIHAGQSIPSV